MEVRKTILEKKKVVSHLFNKSGNLLMGIDHFLVVFPSILIVAKTLDDISFNKNSISLLLFSTGLCNLIFYLITKFEIPIFIAPSFTFIGFTTVTMIQGNGDISMSRLNVYAGYLVASFVFIVIAFLYKSTIVRKYVKLTLPDALVGPLISLIGLDLLEKAIEDSGLLADDNTSKIISLITLCTIIIVTIIKRRRFRNASILIGILAGVGILLFWDV